MMYMTKMGEMEFGSEKMASGRPNRKAKWCKMQVVGVKWA